MRTTLLKLALAIFGVTFLLGYPLAVVWPSGWAWHMGAPYESDYFMMIVGVYTTLGVFLILASRNPDANRSLIWFTVVSSAVHGADHGGAVVRNGRQHGPHGPSMGRRSRTAARRHRIVGADADAGQNRQSLNKSGIVLTRCG
jgi:hypothetical protein